MRKFETALGLILGVTLLSVVSTAGASEYYTWVDENGVTNYSEKEPPGYSAKRVTPQSRFGYRQGTLDNPVQRTPPNPEAAAEESAEDTATPVDPAQMSDEEINQQIAGEKARIDAEIAKVKASNCTIGRRNLAQLQAYARVRVQDDDGTERLLSDSEKAERIARARKTISENCSG